MEREKQPFSVNQQPCSKLWYGIKARCYNPKNPGFKNYGGRGIKMQESWILNFGAFQQYVMSLPKYDLVESEKLTLDRIDNDKGYEEGNLRWATKEEQLSNRREYKKKPRGKKYQEMSPNGRAIRAAALFAEMTSGLLKD